jgi:hypothetical protein
MSVPFVVSEKKVLTVGGIDPVPVRESILHSGYWWVLMYFIVDV